MIFTSDQVQKALGFNDKPIRLFAYPIAGLLIPLAFFREVFEGDWIYMVTSMFISLIHAIVYWEGNRLIVIFHRLKYPNYIQVGKRLAFQMFWVTIYSLIVAVVLEYFFCCLGKEHRPQGVDGPDMATSIRVGVINTYTSILFYECAYFFQRWKQSGIEAERLQREKVETQLESLKNQVNPHFLFNSLNTLTSLIPNDPDEAVEFVQRLAQVYRYVLDVNATRLIPLQAELEFIKSYLFLLQARHGDRLQVSIDIPQDYYDYQLIPLAIQILVENAVKHNVVSNKHPLYVHIRTEGERLIVSNAVLHKKYVSDSTGLGLKNIINRYDLLTDKMVEVEEKKERFSVSIPLILPQ